MSSPTAIEVRRPMMADISQHQRKIFRDARDCQDCELPALKPDRARTVVLNWRVLARKRGAAVSFQNAPPDAFVLLGNFRQGLSPTLFAKTEMRPIH